MSSPLDQDRVTQIEVFIVCMKRWFPLDMFAIYIFSQSCFSVKENDTLKGTEGVHVGYEAMNLVSRFFLDNDDIFLYIHLLRGCIKQKTKYYE
jgi:hypothetical protein